MLCFSRLLYKIGLHKTSSESSTDSLFKEQEKQHETHEVLAACSDAEHSDSSHRRQLPTKQIVQCPENLHGHHLAVIEERQKNSVQVVTEPALEHEDDDFRSDNYLPNISSSLLPPQGGDISIQDDIQQTDSDFGSEDLFSPLNSRKHKNHQIHQAASITLNMEESDQDRDVIQTETEGQFVSIFGPGTARWCDGVTPAHKDNITQTETEGQSVLGPGTPNKQKQADAQMQENVAPDRKRKKKKDVLNTSQIQEVN